MPCERGRLKIGRRLTTCPTLTSLGAVELLSAYKHAHAAKLEARQSLQDGPQPKTEAGGESLILTQKFRCAERPVRLGQSVAGQRVGSRMEDRPNAGVQPDLLSALADLHCQVRIGPILAEAFVEEI